METCRCPCHWHSGILNTKPDLRSPIAAVLACDLCAPLHASAIHYGSRQSFTRPRPLPSADGYPYDPSDPLLDDDK